MSDVVQTPGRLAEGDDLIRVREEQLLGGRALLSDESVRKKRRSHCELFHCVHLM